MRTSINQIIKGGLTDQYRYFPGNDSKRSMIDLTIASSSRYRDKTTREWVNGDTDYISVRLYGGVADQVNTLIDTQKIVKGSPLIVIGKFDPQPKTWISKDGEPRAQIVFNAETLTIDLLAQVAREKNRENTNNTTVDEWEMDGFMDTSIIPF
ncbi:single-stranded DNA-binding protein [Alloscardovia theropitheci]|uniref:Single-stranded DNA-binding protein n=1 Tax=Alloscardovia theropitheci TaxID=2496842 RepID=A0A4R0QNU2_9BIFI|nr:single-stranded DNA-binding protein [Alloscardovia theropitheci]TCD53854.1 single-stranded DNA-binding protein [Alloscardovia theropitheci]